MGILREKGKVQGRQGLGLDVGRQVLQMLRDNPKTSAKQVQIETGLPYYEAWTVLKNCRTFELEKDRLSGASFASSD
jgi:hypothetical protein